MRRGKYRRHSMVQRGRAFEAPRAALMIMARIRQWRINWQ